MQWGCGKGQGGQRERGRAPLAAGGLALLFATLGRVDSLGGLGTLLSLMMPVVASFALVCFLCAVRSRHRRIALAGMVAAIVVPLSALLPFMGGSGGGGMPSSRMLRIVEFNAWLANRSPEVSADWILAQRPDVVVLLEAEERGGIVADKLAATFPYRTSCRGGERCSTLILSRIPPVERLGLAHGDADNRRALSAALVRFGAPLSCTVVAVHLSQPLPFGRQDKEVGQLVNALAGRDDRRLVVTGDFNAPGWSTTVRRVASSLAVSPLLVAPGWPSSDWVPPFLDLDHSFVGQGWRDVRIERGPAVGSDHRPYVVTFGSAA